MRNITYYVATSLDGFIAGPQEDISGFVQGGDGVDQYLQDLQSYDTVVMGRKTYEFGYKFGLRPGQPAYPHMEHHIFSRTLAFDQPHGKVHVHQPNASVIRRLKKEEGTDIYLCGGGVFAGWLLDLELIDKLKIKLNPLILGAGVPLFGSSRKSYQLELLESQAYENGLQIMTFNLVY